MLLDAVAAGADAAPRAGVRRRPDGHVFSAGRRRVPVAVAPRGVEPDPDAVAAAAALIARRGAAGVHRRAATSSADGPGRAARGSPRRCGVPVLRERAGPRLPARRPPAGVRRARVAAEDRGRRRRGGRHAARLPARRSADFGDRAGRAHRRLRRAGAATHATLAGVAGRRPAPRSSTALADCERRRRRPRAVDRPAARRPRTPPRPSDADAARPPTATRSSRPAVYGELRPRLDRDAVVICDGGDFVSYAGKYVDSYQPGCWLDPGPYGCLGTGLGLRDRGPGRPTRSPGRR